MTGYVRNPDTAAKAIKLGVVDKIENNLTAAVDKAELVILATPVLSMKEILEQIGPQLTPGCTVTDVASTKVKVMQWAEEYLQPEVNFIGGHPMAGKEISGIEAAEATLFEHRIYCLVPGRFASPEATQGMIELVNMMGARHLVMPASAHDNFVAGISHLPLIISSSLVMATTQSPLWGEMSRLAATGYQSVTRLASQHPRMNRDICLTNQQNILDWMDQFIIEMYRFRHLIAEGGDELERAFTQVQQARARWIEGHDKRD